MTSIVSLMHVSPVTVDMDATLAEVDKVLRTHGLSAVPVTDRRNGVLLGVVSARDLAHAVHTNHGRRDPAVVHAWEMCTYKPVQVSVAATVGEVARLMLGHGIHHVVVTDDKGIAGIVSALDFVRQFSGEA